MDNQGIMNDPTVCHFCDSTHIENINLSLWECRCCMQKWSSEEVVRAEQPTPLTNYCTAYQEARAQATAQPVDLRKLSVHQFKLLQHMLGITAENVAGYRNHFVASTMSPDHQELMEIAKIDRRLLAWTPPNHLWETGGQVTYTMHQERVADMEQIFRELLVHVSSPPRPRRRSLGNLDMGDYDEDPVYTKFKYTKALCGAAGTRVSRYPDWVQEQKDKAEMDADEGG